MWLVTSYLHIPSPPCTVKIMPQGHLFDLRVKKYQQEFGTKF